MVNHLYSMRISCGASIAVGPKEREGMIQYPVDENIWFQGLNLTETVVSKVNQGVRAIFKKK